MKYSIREHPDWGYMYFVLFLKDDNVVHLHNTYSDNWGRISLQNRSHVVWHRETGEIVSQRNVLKIILILYGLNKIELLPPTLR